MNVTPIKTDIVTNRSTSLTAFLDRWVSALEERSILVITSKIVSLCEGSVAPKTEDKLTLIKKEADQFLPPSENTYGIAMTIAHDLLIPAAGIDESNADGSYVLWPRNPQQTANDVRAYLIKRFGVKEVGVLITDSKTTPLRWGTTGVALAHSGFIGIKDFIGKPDLFGRHLEVTKVNVRDGLAASAVLVMGESNEQTPLAVVKDVPFVVFQPRDPSEEELTALHIDVDADVYGAILKRAPWQKGKVG